MSFKKQEKKEEDDISQRHADAYTAMIDAIQKDVGEEWPDDVWIKFYFDDKWKMMREGTQLAHYVENGVYQYSIGNRLYVYRGNIWTLAREWSMIDGNTRLTVFRSCNEDNSVKAEWEDNDDDGNN
jgi:hypothetical protein